MQERVIGKESLVRVATVQFEPIIADKEHNLKRSEELIREAAQNGAKLVILPELCNTGYVLNSRAEAFALSEPVPGGPTSDLWGGLAKELNLFIAAGITEREGVKLFNSEALYGPSGHIGTFRKLHLWYEEKLFFEPGDKGMPVFHTEIGRIAMCICYDMWFPEVFRLAAVQGADIVAVATNWVPIPGQREGEKPMAINLAMANAHCNGIFIACADRIGVERGQPFVGSSVIVNPAGWPIAGPAPMESEAILYADCNLVEARRAKSWSDLNVVLRDRRTDLYDTMLGTGAKPFGW